MGSLNIDQANINKFNARVQYAEKTTGKGSTFVNQMIAGLYTGGTKKYIHIRKDGSIRISKSKEAAEALKSLINQALNQPTIGEAMKWFEGTKKTKIKKINLYSEAKENLNDLLAELYGQSKKGTLPKSLEKFLLSGSITRSKEEIIKAYQAAKKLLERR